MNAANKLSSLEDISLRAVCRDIVRHSLQFQAETDKEDNFHYINLRRMYTDKIVQVLEDRCQTNGIEKTLSASSLEYLSPCLNFIFNSYLEKLPDFSTLASHPEVISAIGRNCKGLLFFDILGTPIDQYLYIPFFKSMKQLVILRFWKCDFSGVATFEAIAESLVHLRVLCFFETNFDDEAAFALCGHKLPLGDSETSCHFTKHCKTQSSLRLHTLVLTGTEETEVGITCILTHIPTIQYLDPTYCQKYVVAEVICGIHMHRQSSGMPRLQLQMEHLIFPDHVKNWGLVFRICPKLRSLEFTICDDDSLDANRVKALAECDFIHLQRITIRCERTSRLLFRNLRRFWIDRGHYLTFLMIAGLDNGHVSYDPEDFRLIISLCPNLKEIHIPEMVLNGRRNRNAILKDFPRLRNVGILRMGFSGDPDLWMAEELRILSSTANLRELTLNNVVEEKVMLDFLQPQSFPCLRLFTIFAPDYIRVYKYTEDGTVICLQ